MSQLYSFSFILEYLWFKVSLVFTVPLFTFNLELSLSLVGGDTPLPFIKEYLSLSAGEACCKEFCFAILFPSGVAEALFLERGPFDLLRDLSWALLVPNYFWR